MSDYQRIYKCTNCCHLSIYIDDVCGKCGFEGKQIKTVGKWVQRKTDFWTKLFFGTQSKLVEKGEAIQDNPDIPEWASMQLGFDEFLIYYPKTDSWSAGRYDEDKTFYERKLSK